MELAMVFIRVASFCRQNGEMKYRIGFALTILLVAFAGSSICADEREPVDERIRIVSWNISDDAFVTEPRAFQSLLRWANPDVVLLDEVDPKADSGELANTLAAIQPDSEVSWTVDIGVSGGRQRCIVASRSPLESLPEFSKIVPYPESASRHIRASMSPEGRSNPDWSMDGGIPVNGAVIRAGSRRLLVVIADLQCCGDGPGSWQEYRRRVEARQIRRLIRQVLQRVTVDGVVLAGDFNMVNSTFPMALLTGPYPRPHPGLIPAELYHPDGAATWTWDGRGTPFPSNALDYQLYGPNRLEMRSGLILDSEGISAEMHEQLDLDANASMRTGRHRPLVAEYIWVEQE